MLWLCWKVAGPELAGRLALALLMSAWVAATFVLTALLCWAHSLWFAFSCLVLPGLVLIERRGGIPSLIKLATQLPIGLVALAFS